MRASTPEKPGFWQSWLLATRPKTLPASIASVIIGIAAAYADGVFRFGPALAALVCAMLLQIGANVSNDYFDFKKGADTAARVGPLRVTQAGLLTPKQVVLGMAVIFILAAIIGGYLIWQGGWVIGLIGLSAILAALTYTGGPYPLGYNGLGEVFVFLFFGLAAVWGTYYAQARTLSAAAAWSALPIGLLIVALLVVNNLRDIATDRQSGKRTLAVRMGENGSVCEYGILLIMAYLTTILGVILFDITAWSILSLLTVPLALRLYREVKVIRGRPLNKTLAATAQLGLLFAILYSLGLVLGRLIH